MAVHELSERPMEMSHFPDDGFYRWFELSAEKTGPYGLLAIGERGDALEMHVTLTRWGSHVRRAIPGDLDWLKAEACRLGKNSIMGVRVSGQGEFDPMLFKFAKMYGFTDICVLQTASLDVGIE